jgi:hypothetical protein
MQIKDKYRLLCQARDDLPLFLQDWWLDAVCGEHAWDVFLIEENGKPIAALPFLKVNAGVKLMLQPPLTQHLGIWINYPPDIKYVKKLSIERDLITELINNIHEQGFLFFNQCFHHSFSNWLPFYWKGFRQTTYYTYVLEDISNLNQVWDGFSTKRRNQIRKAEKLVEVKETDDIKLFYALTRKTYIKQNIPVPYSFALLSKIDKACGQRIRRKILYAVDKDNHIHSAIYTVWDSHTTYYLMGGNDPQFSDSESMSLLVWRSIQESSQQERQFDFEGSMIEPIERFFSSFGPVQKPYFRIWNPSVLGQLIYFLYKVSNKGRQSIFTLLDNKYAVQQQIDRE